MLIAVLAGFLIAVQSITIGLGAERSGPWLVSWLVHAAGLAVGTVWVLTRTSAAEVAAAVRLPWWPVAGIVGFGLVAAVGTAVSRLGAGPAIAVSTATQLVVALVYDAVRTGTPVAPRQVLGALVLVAGAYLVAAR